MKLKPRRSAPPSISATKKTDGHGLPTPTTISKFANEHKRVSLNAHIQFKHHHTSDIKFITIPSCLKKTRRHSNINAVLNTMTIFTASYQVSSLLKCGCCQLTAGKSSVKTSASAAIKRILDS
jgi:hypothetical protein